MFSSVVYTLVVHKQFPNTTWDCCFSLFLLVQLLNDVTGKIDPKEACRLALDLHSKYLRTVSVICLVFSLNLSKGSVFFLVFVFTVGMPFPSIVPYHLLNHYPLHFLLRYYWSSCWGLMLLIDYSLWHVDSGAKTVNLIGSLRCDVITSSF